MSAVRQPSHFACVLLAVSLAALTCARAADDPPKGTPAPPEYRAALVAAVRAFNARDFAGTIAAVDTAEAIRPPTAMTLNMRGAALLEQKKYDEGSAFFRKALELDPKFHPARFNLCEVPFIQGRYPEARAMFSQLLVEDSHDQLVRYRVLLTWLLEKNDAEAQRVLEAIPFPGDTPAYYYGQAAWEFAHDHADEAKKWVARGNWVFKPGATANYSQPFVTLGWLTEPPPATPRLPDGPSIPFPKPPAGQSAPSPKPQVP